MKVWIKLLLGTLAGALLALLLPSFLVFLRGFFPNIPDHFEVTFFKTATEIVIGLGRYALFPFVFFSLAVAINDLRAERRLGSVLWRSFLYTGLFTVILVAIGTLLILVFNPQWIPVTMKKESVAIFQGWNDTLKYLVPQNAFQILTGGADFLLPLYAFAFLLGLNFDFDKNSTQPTVTLFDSLSKIFYHLNSFFVELFGFGIILLSGAWLIQIQAIQDVQLYLQVILVLILATLIVLFGVFPAILYFFGGKQNPYKWIFGMLGAGMGAFFSGDNFFTLGLSMRFSRENLGVPRKVGATTMPLFAMFARAGTAMTTAIAFIVILKSYSAAEITYDQVIWTILFTCLVSFTLPSVPALGAYISLSLLCQWYGPKTENGFLLLQPIVPILVSFSALLDVFAAGLIAWLVSRQEGLQKQIKSKLFI